MTTATRETDTSMGDALERVVDAGQSLFMRRLELVFAEGLRTLRGGALLLLAVPFAILGWLLIVKGAQSGLSLHLPPFAVDLGIGLAHLVVAGLLIRARGRMR